MYGWKEMSVNANTKCGCQASSEEIIVVHEKEQAAAFCNVRSQRRVFLCIERPESGVLIVHSTKYKQIERTQEIIGKRYGSAPGNWAKLALKVGASEIE